MEIVRVESREHDEGKADATATHGDRYAAHGPDATIRAPPRKEAEDGGDAQRRDGGGGERGASWGWSSQRRRRRQRGVAASCSFSRAGRIA